MTTYLVFNQDRGRLRLALDGSPFGMTCQVCGGIFRKEAPIVAGDVLACSKCARRITVRAGEPMDPELSGGAVELWLDDGSGKPPTATVHFDAPKAGT